MSDLRGRAAICELGWPGLDDAERTEAEYQIRWQDDGGVIGIGCEPHFGIGQRALLVKSPHGNILWDCIALLTDEIVARIRAEGGIKGIAISHPHFYTTIVEWAKAFDVPVYLHADDRQWVMRPDDRIVYWMGEVHPLDEDLTLIRCGGHFEGGAVLHQAGNGGALFTGDVLQVVRDRRHVSFMRSFPNYIPLGPAAIRRIEAALEPFAYDRVYGAFWGRNIIGDGKAAVERSVQRYLDWIAR